MEVAHQATQREEKLDGKGVEVKLTKRELHMEDAVTAIDELNKSRERERKTKEGCERELKRARKIIRAQ